MRTALLWFRNDLRIHDNELLKKAEEFDEVLPFYCFDTRQFSKTSIGLPKTGSFRARFLIESVINLRKNLKEMGADLVVRQGLPEEWIAELAEEYQVDKVFVQEEVTREEKEAEQKVRGAVGDRLEFVWGSTLFHKEDIPYAFKDIPDVFTSFRKKTEKESKVRGLIEVRIL